MKMKDLATLLWTGIVALVLLCVIDAEVNVSKPSSLQLGEGGEGGGDEENMVLIMTMTITELECERAKTLVSAA